ncbi:MAG: zf-TFIIB domain-containing protein [Armatimonadetes bacterium]|nr:zf-TFIIB domain-containing protein [Armatimonadota bacterium]MDE2207690.1 zf-TFIIB domain-containing protein [Armatimonadota bacterium]
MTEACPGCAAPMKQETFHGAVINVCGACEGIWFEGGELRDLLEQDPHVFTDLAAAEAQPGGAVKKAPSTLTCPQCVVPLEAQHYLVTSPVIIHGCPQCGGLWVPADELVKMQQTLDASRQPLTPQEDAAISMAAMTAKHEAFMARQQSLTQLFTRLDRYYSGWWGLI